MLIKSCKGIIVPENGIIYEFDFMGGSPIVYAKKIRNTEVELSFYINNSSELHIMAMCTIKQLRDSLLYTSKKIVRAIVREKWQDD